jgi:sec-independent protein translocase protein TatB
MFGLSFTEVVIIAVLALILLGPDKLPDAARTFGKGLREFRRATEDLKDQIETEIYADEMKKRPAAVPPVPASQGGPQALPRPEGVPEYLPGLPAPSHDPAGPVEPAPAPARPEPEVDPVRPPQA